MKPSYETNCPNLSPIDGVTNLTSKLPDMNVKTATFEWPI